MPRPQLPLETERTIIRRFEDRDVADILAYSKHPRGDFHRRQNVGWKRTRAGVRTWWEPMIDRPVDEETKWLGLVVEVKDVGRVVGNVGFSVKKILDHREAMIGWIVGRDYEGNGYITEAATALIDFLFLGEGFHRVYAMTSIDNQRSWAVMERLGMRREAHFVRNCLHDGDWVDEYVYAILASEWPTKRPTG